MFSLSDNIGIVLVFLTIFLSVYWMVRKPNGIPPGSQLTLPFVGDLPLLIEGDILKVFEKLRRKYGDIFSFYMGQKLFIVINGYELINKSAVRKGWTFSGRPREFFPWEGMMENRGILLSNGPLWQRRRKFIHDRLQSFGFGKTSFESKILTEVKCLIEELKSTNHQYFDITEAVQTSMANIMLSILCGKRHDYADPVFRTILKNNDYRTSFNLVYSMVCHCFPLLKHAYMWIPIDIFGIKKLKEIDEYFRNYVKTLYDIHVENYTGDVNDLMDVYIKEMQTTDNDEKRSEFTFDQLHSVMDDLLGAGSETSSTAIRWAVVYLLNYPELKNRLQIDIDKVVPDSRLPCLEDKAQLPYVEAFVMEILRLTNIAPFGLPHAILGENEVIFQGFRIPNDCGIFFNFQSVHLDPQNFDDPLLFNPGRFLDTSGQLVKPKEFMPFGAGRRVCLGEPVAKMEIFLFLTALIKTFDFLPEEPGKIPGTRAVLGLTNAPVPYKIRALSRR